MNIMHNFIFLSLALVACAPPAGNNTAEVHEMELSKKLLPSELLAQAREALNSTPTGQKILEELDGGNEFHQPIKVRMVSTKVMKSKLVNVHVGGGIVVDPDTKAYKIMINDAETPMAAAHAIAHQMIHIRQHALEEKFFSKSDSASIHRMLNKANQWIQSGKLNELLGDDPQTAVIKLATEFYEEWQAFSVNKALIAEGLPYLYKSESGAVNGDLAAFVNDRYVKKLGAVFSEGSLKKLASLAENSRSLVDFQKALAQTVGLELLAVHS